MGLFGKKPKPKSDSDILLDALGGVKKGEERKKRTMRRKMGGGWKRFLDNRILIGLGIILVLIIGDGVRRENREFEATLSAINGQVWIQETDTAPLAPAVAGEKLVDGNVVVTAANGGANLTFPDGSLLMIGPGSSLTVKLLEYNRGAAWRSRSFYMKVGTVWAKVSQNFGKGSTMKVYTPSSVAAVRGTTFYVYQARSGENSQVACAEGEVRVRGFLGEPVYLAQGAVANVARGASPSRPAWMNAQQNNSFSNDILWRPPPNASKLQVFEYGVNQFLNAPLTVLGIGKCGWAFGAIDSTRRSAAMEALRRLQIHLEGSAEYPAYVNPATLEELGLDEASRKQVLDQLYGNSIDRYIPAAGRDYTIYARARDKDRTAFKLTSHGLVFCTKEEAAALEEF
jgi:hypothetical protein